MLPTKNGRSYSDFFTSGFKAMTTRSVQDNMSSTSIVDYDMSSTPKSSRSRSSFFDFTKRHSRMNSMILSPSTSTINAPQSSSFTPRERRERHASFISFSSRLFERRAGTHTDNSLSFSNMPYKNSRELLNSTDVLEVWITAGGPFTPISYEDSIVFQPIDPFASSRDSKSFFSEWIETPTSSKRSSKAQRESFLSFSGSSFDWSFLPLPRHRRNRRRERPVSVQTVPSPSSPRHASPSHRRFSSTPDSFSPSYKRSSYFVDPSKGESWMPDKQPFEEDCSWQKPRPAEQQRADPIQSVDWRQFHLEVLQQEA